MELIKIEKEIDELENKKCMEFIFKCTQFIHI